MSIITIPTSSRTSGPWSECHAKDPTLTEAQWHRGQMRSWAGFWRRRYAIAARLGKSVAEVGDTHLSLAKTYRDHSLKLEAAKS
jgi:hypothetical protein